MDSVSSLMDGQVLLPIIQVDNEHDGVAIAKAMHAAGLKTVEVVLRSEQSAKAGVGSVVSDLLVFGTPSRSFRVSRS